ncbi:trypsin-like serine protease [Streptomyces seoulensis]|uniref:trypsin-like serine protease n=1 Tax=Streptomyces seoulensis TaxID=73044 RepID=UPI0033BEA76D
MAAAPLALSAAPAQAATGPAVAPSAFSFAARLDIGNGQRACSAVLVASQWLATSASCFSDDPASGQAPTAGAPKWKTTATIGRTDLTSTSGQVREVVELVPRPDRDIVLARLASPTTGIAAVTLAKTAPTAGDELTVAGFGRTTSEWAPTKLHTAAFTVDSADSTTLAIHGKTAADAICSGDTGAPIVRQKDGKTELVALASRSWQGGCFGSDPAEARNNAVSARVDNTVGGNTLTAGTVLTAGDSLTSNAARLTLQSDGNLVIVSDAGTTVWSSKTAGHPGATARFDANGNLAVIDADGTTVLWETKTATPGGKAVLQDRGDFVIYNASNQSQWAAGTVVRHDYNGDGRDDLGALYGYPTGEVALLTFPTTPNGGFSDTAIRGWSTTGWAFDRASIFSGDFNGDGRDDMATWYDYSDGHDAVISFNPSGSNGEFGNRKEIWNGAAGSYTRGQMQLVTGDYNGDGRDDLATLYGYANGSTKTITWTAKPDGTLNSPLHSWEASDWSFERASMIERYNSPS